VGAAAAPAGGAVPMLGHRHPARRHHEGGDGGDVERARAVAAGATGVHRPAGREGDGARAHGAREADDLVLRLAPHGEGGEEGADLGGRGLPIHDDPHGLARLVLGEALAPRDLGQVWLHGRSRKLPSSFLPTAVRMLSGWNWTPSRGCSRWRRPITTPSSVQAVTSRQEGTVSRSTISEW